MSVQTVITLQQVCEWYDFNIDIARDFADFGLYPVIPVEGGYGIEDRHLERVERVISLHRSLGVNKEGIDIILELRAEITRLQEEVEASMHELGKMKAFAYGAGSLLS